MKLLRCFVVFLVVLFAASFVCPAFAEPDKPTEPAPPPSLSARAVYLVEAQTDVVLYQSNAETKMYPASLTKIMTALLLVESIPNFDQVIEVDPAALDGLSPSGSTANLVAGEQMSVKALLQCLLISSGNDAANAAAMAVSPSVSDFIELMNQKAAALGCENTNFVNAHGLHDENHYTTAKDMYIITREFRKHDILNQISAMSSAILPPTNMRTNEKTILNTNSLISRYRDGEKYIYKYAKGIKTGHTTPAGYCLVSCAEKDDTTLVAVVMGCKQDSNSTLSFVDSKALYQWAFENFAVKTVVSINDLVREVKVTMGKDADFVSVAPKTDLLCLLPIGVDIDQVERRITLPDSIAAPVEKGQVLGTIELVYDGQKYASGELISFTAVDRSVFMYFLNQIRGFFMTPIVLLISSIVFVVLLFYFMVVRRAARRRRNKRYYGRR